MRSLTQLIQLDLSANKITHLEALRSLVNLKYLALERNQVTDPRALQPLLTHLSILDL
ncbi:MAG: hypothetical protein F6K19_46215 [Cyanothece sp. SIO1E1]|nr:hypothetical protein [Cyanothece sp. SIO1E1]